MSHQDSAGRRMARGMAGLLACGSPPPFLPSRFPSGRARLGPIRNGNSPLTVAGAATDLPVDRAHRRSLFISLTGEPSGVTVNEDDRPGQSNARRKTLQKGNCPLWAAGGVGGGSASDNPPNRNRATSATRPITASAAITIPAGMELILRRVIKPHAGKEPFPRMAKLPTLKSCYT